ncbi:AAA family ATPase [Exiguobacterium undae]|uniref:AAA family ATPase n=1 Tax=Exiguobacterium undae TaxID=169177 RepID=UPI00047D76AF|nr:AAA family ATPase [Exiguobacterium undae]
MKLEINNLAHIENANFNDESDLTVIVGDNGTGKTIFLETLLLIKKKKSDLIKKIVTNSNERIHDLEIIFGENFEGISNFIAQEEFKNAILEKNDVIDKIDLDGIVENFDWEGTIKFHFNNTKLLENHIHLKFDELERQLPDLISREIFFDTSFDTNIKISNDKINIKDKYEINVRLRKFNNIFIFIWESNNKKTSSTISVLNKNENLSNFLNNNFFQLLLEYIFEEEIGYSINDKIIMIPTERSQLMLTSNDEFKDFFDSQRKNMRYSESAFLTEYFLHKGKNSRNYLRDSRGYNQALVDMIGGEINLDEDGNVVSLKENSGNEIDWRLFSTKQNRIIPYLMIDDIIKNNDLQLIIEEPESNLSLKSIREICHYLVNLLRNSHKNNNSVKIILTTHSDVFFQVLNLELLRNKDITSKVYEFQEFNAGDSLKNILYEQKNSDLGYKIKLFGDELLKLYNETLELQNSMENEDNYETEIIISDEDY